MTYVRGADAAVFKALGISTDWTERYHERFDGFDIKPAAAQPRDASGKPVILSGRSIYYGAFLYVSDQLAGLVLAAILQAALAAICILLTIARFRQTPPPDAAPLLVVFTIVLSFCSSLAFFAAYLVPDLLCALAILAAANLLLPTPLLTTGTKVFWFAVLAFGALSHSSVLLILGLVLLLAIFIRKRLSKQGIAMLALGLGIAIVGEALFYESVLHQFGEPPVRPPFLMARLVADGPGRAYLEDHCSRPRFALCRYRSTLSDYRTSASSDTFLWAHDITQGVFSAVTPNEQRRLAKEETPFVIAVFADRPLDVLRTSILAVVDQATRWQLDEFNVSAVDRREFAHALPRRVWNAEAPSRAFNREMPVTPIEALTPVVALLSLITFYLKRRVIGSDLAVFCCLLLVGIVADVIVCGAISTPHSRYLMRVIWLLPLAALLTLVAPREEMAPRELRRP